MSNKKTGFEDLINSYIEGTSYVAAHRYDTKSYQADKEEIERIKHEIGLAKFALAAKRQYGNAIFYTNLEYGPHEIGTDLATPASWEFLLTEYIEALQQALEPLLPLEFYTSAKTAVERVGLTEELEEELVEEIVDNPELIEQIKDRVEHVLFQGNFPTTEGYHVEFIPSGGHALFVPDDYSIDANYSNQLARQHPKLIQLRYVVIKLYEAIRAPFGWELYPILPHLTYVDYSDEYAAKYAWILGIKPEWDKTKERQDLPLTVFDWRHYFKTRKYRGNHPITDYVSNITKTPPYIQKINDWWNNLW